MSNTPTRTLPLPAHLALYFGCSLSYACICGLLGRTYSPLAVYQTYSLACGAALVVALAAGRLTKLWEWRKLWPPSAPATAAAVASIVIMTASTLALLSPASLLAIIAGKAGRLLLVARRGALALPVLAMGAVVLAAWTKPPSAAVVPLLLAGAYVFGYWIKLKACAASKRQAQTLEVAKVGHVLPGLAREYAELTETQTRQALVRLGQGLPAVCLPEQRERTEDFIASEQVVVALGSLGIASLMAHFAPPAHLSDWRLWAIGAASLGAGLIGTRIMMRVEPASVTFPAYSMASLLASMGAAWSRGELGLAWRYWPSISAAVLALVVVGAAAGGFALAGRWGRAAVLAIGLRLLGPVASYRARMLPIVPV